MMMLKKAIGVEPLTIRLEETTLNESEKKKKHN